MNHYLMIKYLHIISSVLLVGTGFGSAFYLYFVNRSKGDISKQTLEKLRAKAKVEFLGDYADMKLGGAETPASTSVEPAKTAPLTLEKKPEVPKDPNNKSIDKGLNGL